MQHQWPEAIAAVFVICHPEKEKARAERLLPHLVAAGVPADRIRLCAPTWGSDLSLDFIFKVYDPFLRRMGAARELPAFSFKSSGLLRGEISLALNLYAAFREAAALEPDRAVLILESDVWVRSDFIPRLNDLLADLRQRYADIWDYVSLGEGAATRVPGAPASMYSPTRAYPPPHQWVFRCTDSMLFRVEFLKRVCQTYIPFKEPTDWEMNYQLGMLGGKALWTDPPLAEQGTWNNRLATTLPS